MNEHKSTILYCTSVEISPERERRVERQQQQQFKNCGFSFLQPCLNPCNQAVGQTKILMPRISGENEIAQHLSEAAAHFLGSDSGSSSPVNRAIQIWPYDNPKNNQILQRTSNFGVFCTLTICTLENRFSVIRVPQFPTLGP
jgi:hypothetical protein